ncbi:MAG: hypothetical protein ACTS27_01760 [Phycisphaerales bacterium]
MPVLLANIDGETIKWLAIGGIAIVAIAGGYITKIVTTHSREKSRREIAAYIAEGSMTPEQGERLMRAANPDDE